MVGLCKELSRDPIALDMLSMSRVTASYKIREGHGVVNYKRLVNDLKVSYFSMNLDECFSNNNQKVMSVLVTFLMKQ
jgi:hypothetical protein